MRSVQRCRSDCARLDGVSVSREWRISANSQGVSDASNHQILNLFNLIHHSLVMEHHGTRF